MTIDNLQVLPQTDASPEVVAFGTQFWASQIKDGKRVWQHPERCGPTGWLSNPEVVAHRGVEVLVHGRTCARCGTTPWQPTARGMVLRIEASGTQPTNCRACTPTFQSHAAKIDDAEALSRVRDAAATKQRHDAEWKAHLAEQKQRDAQRQAASPVPYLDSEDPVERQVAALLQGVYRPGTSHASDPVAGEGETHRAMPDPLTVFLSDLATNVRLKVDLDGLLLDLRAAALRSGSPRYAETVTVFAATAYAMREATATPHSALLSACATLRRAMHLPPEPTAGLPHSEKGSSLGLLVLKRVQAALHLPDPDETGFRHTFTDTERVSSPPSWWPLIDNDPYGDDAFIEDEHYY